MSAPRWRWWLIALWVALGGVAFLVMGSTTLRAFMVLAVLGVVPPVMLLWLWNDDGPLVSGRAQGYR